MTTALNTLQDRHQRAADLLDSMASADRAGRAAALRDLAAQCLGLSAVNRPSIAVNGEARDLPDTASVIAEMPNPYGNDIIAAHFDLSAVASAMAASGRVNNAQAQAANAVVYRHAGAARAPLLIFTLPDRGGVQFIYGEPEPGNPRRLRSIHRLTYRWGEYNRTTLDALERIGQEIASGRDSDTGEEKAPQIALSDGFNVQPVTERFFKDYKAAYDATAAELAAQMSPADAAAYTQTLFNRLLFVHFVSRKGWLAFNGNKDYLNALWHDYQDNPAQTNFYAQRLDALFHDGMNTPEPARAPGIASVIGQVPYLNGGLFERNALDQQGIIIGDHIIEALLSLDGLFNRYNFTVTEATPLDTEVAVDPEMLGKLFEETVNERHSNGAYYTPRPVVSFMCRAALKGYLAGRNIPGLAAAGIADLVDNHNPDAITQQQALVVANAVSDLKAVDPACGSGAFLLGMMQEILTLNDSLFLAGHTPDTLYRQKLSIITNNIYGADKDELAVSTAMLRLWLSLAVDYDGAGPPDPLPNLDLKLVSGDAVLGPDPQQLDFTLQSIVDSGLQQDIAAYTTAHGPDKAALKQRVDAAKAQLRRNLKGADPEGAVEWRIDFADVILAGGFHIVIANPPYVRHEEIAPKSYKDSLLKRYPDAAEGRSDLYCYFYARGLQLLRDGGMHVFVCSNSWLDVGYGAKLQECILDHAAVDAIYESAVERQFATADINTVISVLRKGLPDAGHATRFVRLLDKFETALKPAGNKRVIYKTAAELRAAGTDPNRRKPAGKNGKGGNSGYVGDKWGGKYLRAPDIYHHILKKYGDKMARLGDIATVRFGIKTGANDFFYLTPEVIAEFGIEPAYCRPVLTTPQESRSIAVAPASLPRRLFMCHRDKADLAGAGALAYIEWGEKQGYHRRRSVTSRRRWYDLGEQDNVHLGMNNLVGDAARTFFAPEGVLFTHNFQIFHVKGDIAGRLCTAMNSTLFQLMVGATGVVNYGGGVLRIETYENAKMQVVLPNLLPEPDATVFNATDWDVLTPSAARRHIDAAVYDALGLTADEREAVHAGVVELLGNRKRRAGSVRPGG